MTVSQSEFHRFFNHGLNDSVTLHTGIIEMSAMRKSAMQAIVKSILKFNRIEAENIQ
jgi:hypothetical protein